MANEGKSKRAIAKYYAQNKEYFDLYRCSNCSKIMSVNDRDAGHDTCFKCRY